MNEKFSEKEGKLENFKKEVARLKKEEEENLNEKGQRKTAHFEGIDPSELSEADMVIHQRLLNKELGGEEFNIYRDQIQKSGNNSQKQFSAYIANKLFIQMYKDKS